MSDDDTTPPAPEQHPLERAHRFFRRAAPVLRDVNDTIERHGGVEGVRDLVIERASDVVKRVDEVVANATAIEGEVVERPTPEAGPTAVPASESERTVPPATPVQPAPPRGRWVALGIVIAAATYGALRLMGRPTGRPLS